MRLQAIEMVVADGGSRDRTRDIVLGLRGAFPNLRLIDNPKRLVAATAHEISAHDHATRAKRTLVGSLNIFNLFHISMHESNKPSQCLWFQIRRIIEFSLIIVSPIHDRTQSNDQLTGPFG